MKNELQKLIEKKPEEKTICQKCGKPIEDPSFVYVRGSIISNTISPQVFTCAEQMFNYAQGIVMHTICWIETLRTFGSEVIDLSKLKPKEIN